MKIKRPLINPLPDFIEETIPEDQMEEESDELLSTYKDEDQIELDIESQRERMRQVYAGTKFLLKKRTELFEISGLWRTPALPFTMVTLIGIALLMLIGGIFSFNSIPPQIPFFYSFAEGTWNQANKIIIFLFPIVLLAFESLIIYIITKIALFDKRLSATMCWMVTLLNILLLVAIAQIFFLIT
ncbi:MAG: hypothetical protein ABI721_05415 [Candidatus Dojkabacteria bacterium]